MRRPHQQAMDILLALHQSIFLAPQYPNEATATADIILRHPNQATIVSDIVLHHPSEVTMAANTVVCRLGKATTRLHCPGGATTADMTSESIKALTRHLLLVNPQWPAVLPPNRPEALWT